jgi:hypothetical protein
MWKEKQTSVLTHGSAIHEADLCRKDGDTLASHVGATYSADVTPARANVSDRTARASLAHRNLFRLHRRATVVVGNAKCEQDNAL